jgi:PhnB protein
MAFLQVEKVVPMSKQFWGSYFGMFHDRFGIQWMISHDPNRHKIKNQHKN